MRGDLILRLQSVEGGETWNYVSSLLMEGDLKLRLQSFLLNFFLTYLHLLKVKENTEEREMEKKSSKKDSSKVK